MKTFCDLMPPNWAEQKKKWLDQFLDWLVRQESVDGILFGGSAVYNSKFADNDADLFCLVTDLYKTETLLKTWVGDAEGATLINQGYFPWTGQLYSLFFDNLDDFSIDIGLIPFENYSSFFWEPTGHILLDKSGSINHSRIQLMAAPDFNWQPFEKKTPFSMAFISMNKIKKNISRGHLWNALEAMALFRRYLMQIIRNQLMNERRYYGRADRDIEDVISGELNGQFAETVAIYESADIARKAIRLAEIFCSIIPAGMLEKEQLNEDWLKARIEREIDNLNKLCHTLMNISG